MTPQKSYYIAQNGSQTGPFTPEEVKKQVAAGEATSSAMVWSEGMPDWQPLESVFPRGAPTSPPPLPSTPPPLPPNLPQSKSRTKSGCIWGIVAVVVAVILFGGLVFLCSRLITQVEQLTSAGESEIPLAEERAEHTPAWQESEFESSGPPDIPPDDTFELIHYDSPAGKLAAYLTPDPGDGEKHPAMVWAKGGFGGIGRFLWEPASKRNDQTARAFREKGIVLMCPSWRGENDNPGRFELFYGEVDDLLAAIQHVKSLPYVDPNRVYIGGHSTGGTLTLLAGVSNEDFRAAFAFGGMPDATEILGSDGGFGNTPYADNSILDHRLRSAIRYTRFIRKPVFYFEGAESPYHQSAARMEDLAKKYSVPFRAFKLPGDHFDVLHPLTHHIADLILADDGPEFDAEIQLSELEKAYARAFSNSLAASLPQWSMDGKQPLAEFLETLDPDDATPHTTADISAIADLANRMAGKPLSLRTILDFTSLADLQFEIETDDTWAAFVDQVIPTLVDWANGHMNQASALSTENAKAFVVLVESLLYSGDPDAMACGLASLRSGMNLPSHTWSTLMSPFDEENSDTQAWYDSIAGSLPDDPEIALALLESANDTFLSGWDGTHPFDSPDGMTRLKTWLQDRNPETSHRAHPSALSLAFLQSNAPQIASLLRLGLKHSSTSVQMEAAWSDVHHGGSAGLEFLKQACLEVHQSSRAQSYLKELDKGDAVPQAALDPTFAATAEMSNWLQHPNELGDPPITLEVFDQRQLFWPPADDQRDVWLFRYTYRIDDDTEDQTGYGMVGGMTWSSFQDYETPPSPEELYLHHCALELKRNTRNDAAATDDENRREALEALQKANPGTFDQLRATAP